MKYLLVILFFFYSKHAAALWFYRPVPIIYYISTSGNNASAGTSPGTAWQTLAKLNSVTLNPGDVVNLNRGDTWNEPLPINQSGTAGNVILYGTYGTGAMPVITGFTNLTSWTNLGSNIWEATFNAGSSNATTKEFLMTVVLNGKLTAQGRWPNFTAAEKGYRHQESHTTYTVTDNELTGTPNWTGGQYVTRAEEYNILKARITGHTTTTLTHVGIPFYAPKDNWGYFIQNHPSTLDSLGEWYYDSTATKLKMYSTSNPSTIGTGVQVGGINELCSISSKSYILINAIRFEGADETAIKLTSSNNIEIQNCVFVYSIE